MELVVEMAGFPLVSFTTGKNGERVFKKSRSAEEKRRFIAEHHHLLTPNLLKYQPVKIAPSTRNVQG